MKTLSFVLVAGLLVLSAVGCGGGASPSTPVAPLCKPSAQAEFAYVLSGYAVSMYSIDSCTGALKATSPATIATGSTQNEPRPEQIVADPLGRFAYVANLVSNASDKATISMYTIDSSTGVLTPTSPATVATGFFPQGIAVDPSGRFVYTANSDDNSVSMFRVDQVTGLLTPTSPATVAAGWSPSGVTIHPSGKFAYVTNEDDSTVSMYTIDPDTGVLTPMKPASVATAGSPFGIAISPSGKFAYVPGTYSADNRVSEYTIDQTTGVLTPTSQNFVIAGTEPTAVAVDPSSSFVYVANRKDNTVSMFKINPVTGELTANGTIATGDEPFRITFDPSGKYMYVADENSAAAVFTVNAEGTLTPAPPQLTGTTALSIATTAAKR
ncbi:lactonase family protein [Edaphobacter sp.]|uniref:lactonase family protein n=1 Tax=Edaphobacter sp. TaxID=1934404 RepID=UPI002DB7395E|nr:beta-propeller fold lactonase family protein [Edaphobacter sp.]HEU5340046.1 beta-propeller fold lactonase family protein [Edaphobacter sp.]